MNKANILIIEDDADIREGIRILLESENYTVQEAENGHAGLKLLTPDTDLVILDVMMPGISGLKTVSYTHLGYISTVVLRSGTIPSSGQGVSSPGIFPRMWWLRESPAG